MASFYENQQQARRKTGLLAFYFAVAVLLIVLAVDIILFLVDRYFVVTQSVVGPSHQFDLSVLKGFFIWLTSGHGWLASAATLLILLAGSAFKMAQLSKGGDQVAIMAGGTWVDLNTTDARERQLLNIVEEMAIASGIKPPRVYLLRQETGINAFVAGLTPNDAALAITQGALNTLNRDELQGVIGHEFSHILNSDMRINVQMIGVLAGILMIGRIGRVLMDMRGRRVVSSGKKGSNPLPLIGFGLFVIGAVGLFFGQLIKAALSRQREFLADASAVQFTRNPLGIGGALLKIRDASQHSFLTSSHADDVSHMCFGSVMRHRFSGLFATHPPLEERIRAIDPALEARLTSTTRQSMAPSMPSDDQATLAFQSEETPLNLSPQRLKSSVGTMTEATVHWAESLRQRMPASLVASAHHPDKAQTLLYAMVLAAPQHDAAVNQALKALFPDARLAELIEFRQQVTTLPVALRLPLFDITMPTLQHLPTEAKQNILQTLRAVIGADKRYTISECAYHLLAQRYLLPPAKPQRTINSLQKVEAEIVCFFVTLTQAARRDTEAQCTQFQHAMRCLGITADNAVLQQPLSASALAKAMHTLAALSPLLKRSLIDNAVDMVLADQCAQLTELELLRAFCELLDCPMPPISGEILPN